MKCILIHNFPYYYHPMEATYVNVPEVSDQSTTRQFLGSVFTHLLQKGHLRTLWGNEDLVGCKGVYHTFRFHCIVPYFGKCVRKMVALKFHQQCPVCEDFSE